jgi:hypothetical protein
MFWLAADVHLQAEVLRVVWRAIGRRVPLLEYAIILAVAVAVVWAIAF